MFSNPPKNVMTGTPRTRTHQRTKRTSLYVRVRFVRLGTNSSSVRAFRSPAKMHSSKGEIDARSTLLRGKAKSRSCSSPPFVEPILRSRSTTRGLLTHGESKYFSGNSAKLPCRSNSARRGDGALPPRRTMPRRAAVVFIHISMTYSQLLGTGPDPGLKRWATRRTTCRTALSFAGLAAAGAVSRSCRTPRSIWRLAELTRRVTREASRAPRRKPGARSPWRNLYDTSSGRPWLCGRSRAWMLSPRRDGLKQEARCRGSETLTNPRRSPQHRAKFPARSREGVYS